MREGLQKALLNTSDLVRHLLTPLVTQAIGFLSHHLPITDVAQVEFSVDADTAWKKHAEAQGLANCDLNARIRKYHRRAAPTLRATAAKQHSGVCQAVTSAATVLSDVAPVRNGDQTPASDDRCFLLVPASDAGKRYGEQAQAILSDLQLVNVPGQADLMFCREQEELRTEDLERILQACRVAYDELAGVPQSSPHARFDILGWMPLEP
jgi:hypothetical protein